MKNDSALNNNAEMHQKQQDGNSTLFICHKVKIKSTQRRAALLSRQYNRTIELVINYDPNESQGVRADKQIKLCNGCN